MLRIHAYSYELARSKIKDGLWTNFGPRKLGFVAPSVPDGMARNLRRLVALPELPHLMRALETMSRCNGGINITRSREQFLAETELWLVLWPIKNPDVDVDAIDAWISTLSDEDVLTLVDGEESESVAIAASAPRGTRELLADHFEEVC